MTDNILSSASQMILNDAQAQVFRARVCSVFGNEVYILRDNATEADAQSYPKAAGLIVNPGDEVTVARIGQSFIVQTVVTRNDLPDNLIPIVNSNALVKGDIIGAAAPGAWGILAPGADGQSLLLDSVQPLGLRWGAGGEITFATTNQTMPQASTKAGQHVGFLNTNTGTNVTVAPFAGDTLFSPSKPLGLTAPLILGPGSAVVFISDGATGWYVISGGGAGGSMDNNLTWLDANHAVVGLASMGDITQTSSASPSGWVTASKMIAIPFSVSQARTVAKISVVIGTATSGNIDVGLLDSAGAKLQAAGSTAMGTADTEQVFDITDQPLAADTTYYAAVAVDNTTGRVRGIALATANGPLARVVEKAAAFPIPAANALLALTATTVVPLVILEFA